MEVQPEEVIWNPNTTASATATAGSGSILTGVLGGLLKISGMTGNWTGELGKVAAGFEECAANHL